LLNGLLDHLKRELAPLNCKIVILDRSVAGAKTERVGIVEVSNLDGGHRGSDAAPGVPRR
jgi:hypothetical protein